MEITNLVTKLLGPPEEINGSDRSPIRLQRWVVFGNRHLTIYLHHVFGSTCDEDLRNYPRRFISVGLAESYLEDAAKGLDVFPDQAAWMVLIGKSSPSQNCAQH
jgi:hypothetical protein